MNAPAKAIESQPIDGQFARIDAKTYAVATTQKLSKGDRVTVLTKHGKPVDCVIYKRLGYMPRHYGEQCLYSYTRADGKTAQDFAKAKANRRREWQKSRETKRDDASEAATKLLKPLRESGGQPILTDHYSAKYHRRDLNRHETKMRHWSEHSEMAKEHARIANYWDNVAKDVRAADGPHTLKYFTVFVPILTKLHEYNKKRTRQLLKDNPEHNKFVLTDSDPVWQAKQNQASSKEKLKYATKQLELATTLWKLKDA